LRLAFEGHGDAFHDVSEVRGGGREGGREGGKTACFPHLTLFCFLVLHRQKALRFILSW